MGAKNAMATHVADASVAAAVRGLVLRDGFAKTARALGCHREGVARIIAGIPVRAGTIALVERSLKLLSETEE